MIEPAVVILAEAPLAAKIRGLRFPPAVHVTEFFRIGGAVDPVVVGPEQAVWCALGIGQMRALRVGHDSIVGRDHDLLVGLAVAVGVAPEGKFGRSADEQSVGDRQNRAGQDQAVHEDGALVVTAVAVAIGEDDDATDGGILAVAVKIRHVATHLCDPHAAVYAERDGHRFLHQRLGGRELELVTGGDGKRRKGFRWRQCWRRRNPPGGNERALNLAHLVEPVTDLG